MSNGEQRVSDLIPDAAISVQRPLQVLFIKLGAFFGFTSVDKLTHTKVCALFLFILFSFIFGLL